MAEKRNKGELSFRSAFQLLLALKWGDKKDVWTLSTAHSAEMAETTTIDRQKGLKKLKPSAALDYNKSMGSDDKSNKVIKTVESIRKSTKSYSKVFFHIVDMTLYNSHCQ